MPSAARRTEPADCAGDCASRTRIRSTFARPAAGCAAGFFRGIPGIGYGLLRLARPSRVPDVLLLD